jgi:hypothetical protein
VLRLSCSAYLDDATLHIGFGRRLWDNPPVATERFYARPPKKAIDLMLLVPRIAVRTRRCECCVSGAGGVAARIILNAGCETPATAGFTGAR